MLALPVASGQIGFFPSTLTMFLCYLFMTATGLLLFEVQNAYGQIEEKEAHVLTLVTHMFGNKARAVAWGSFAPNTAAS